MPPASLLTEALDVSKEDLMRSYLSCAGILAALWGSVAFAHSAPSPWDAAEGRTQASAVASHTAISARASSSLNEGGRVDLPGNHVLVSQSEAVSRSSGEAGATGNQAEVLSPQSVVIQSYLAVIRAANEAARDSVGSIPPPQVDIRGYPAVAEVKFSEEAIQFLIRSSLEKPDTRTVIINVFRERPYLLLMGLLVVGNLVFAIRLKRRQGKNPPKQ